MPAPMPGCEIGGFAAPAGQHAVNEAAGGSIDRVADEHVAAGFGVGEERDDAGHQAGGEEHAVLCAFDLRQALVQRFVRGRAVAAIGPAAGLEQFRGAFDDDGGGALDDGVNAALRELAVAGGVGEARAEPALAGSCLYLCPGQSSSISL